VTKKVCLWEEEKIEHGWTKKNGCKTKVHSTKTPSMAERCNGKMLSGMAKGKRQIKTSDVGAKAQEKGGKKKSIGVVLGSNK